MLLNMKTTGIGQRREDSLDTCSGKASRHQDAELQAEEKGEDEIKIQKAKIEADKELTLKELELKAKI